MHRAMTTQTSTSSAAGTSVAPRAGVDPPLMRQCCAGPQSVLGDHAAVVRRWVCRSAAALERWASPRPRRRSQPSSGSRTIRRIFPGGVPRGGRCSRLFPAAPIKTRAGAIGLPAMANTIPVTGFGQDSFVLPRHCRSHGKQSSVFARTSLTRLGAASQTRLLLPRIDEFSEPRSTAFLR